MLTFHGALRAALARLDLDCGAPRLPALPLSDEGKKALQPVLDSVDFFKIAEM